MKKTDTSKPTPSPLKLLPASDARKIVEQRLSETDEALYHAATESILGAIEDRKFSVHLGSLQLTDAVAKRIRNLGYKVECQCPPMEKPEWNVSW